MKEYVEIGLLSSYFLASYAGVGQKERKLFAIYIWTATGFQIAQYIMSKTEVNNLFLTLLYVPFEIYILITAFSAIDTKFTNMYKTYKYAALILLPTFLFTLPDSLYYMMIFGNIVIVPVATRGIVSAKKEGDVYIAAGILLYATESVVGYAAFSFGQYNWAYQHMSICIIRNILIAVGLWKTRYLL